MYVWSLHPNTKSAKHILVKFMQSTNYISISEYEEVEDLINNSGMSSDLKKMMQVALHTVQKDINNRRARSSLIEMLAGLDYAASDISVGSLRHLKSCFDSSKNSLAMRFLHEYCHGALLRKEWQSKDAWFTLRVRCMDAYVLCWIFATSKPLVVYYAGKAHTHITADFLKANGATKATTSPPVVEKIRKLGVSNGILHFETLQMREKIVVFIGEDHNQTALPFATGLVHILHAACSGEDMLFLIEKHISNTKDPLQCELMCNQPHIAIHRTRCDHFVDSEHTSCPALQIQAVDNRHADLGFLRVEIFDLWENAEFRAAAVQFQRRAMECLCAFCKRHIKD